MKDNVSEYQDTDAVNCFTSCVVYLVNETGKAQISEEDLLIYGQGFQFRSNLDEYGFPEIIFDVIETSKTAIDRMGGNLCKDLIKENTDWLGVLTELLVERAQIIVWVNSSHLKYNDVYFKRKPYLHAITLKGYNAALDEFEIFDSLIIDKRKRSTHASISRLDLKTALFDEIQGNELAPEMGAVFSICNAHKMGKQSTLQAEIARQVEANINVEQHRDCITHYHEYCMSFFLNSDKDRPTAARRLFEHISTLFIEPSFYHLRNVLDELELGDDVLDHLDGLIQLWRELSILALKFEITEAEVLIPRIEKKFGLIEAQTNILWKMLQSDGRLVP